MRLAAGHDLDALDADAVGPLRQVVALYSDFLSLLCTPRLAYIRRVLAFLFGPVRGRPPHVSGHAPFQLLCGVHGLNLHLLPFYAARAYHWVLFGDRESILIFPGFILRRKATDDFVLHSH